jgi:23S rRNA pseudouridine2605 synthase
MTRKPPSNPSPSKPNPKISYKPKSAKNPATTNPKPSKAIHSTDQSAGERIQKLLARAGLGSRREIERWIAEGKLTVNGNRVEPGYHLKSGDYLQINGRVVKWEKYAEQPTRVLAYNKPVGELVTRRDPEGRPVIFTRLPRLDVGRWIAVGRLDINTSGLLLVTNNGELANRLMHPSRQVEREYAVRILGEVDEAVLQRLQQGVELDDGPAQFETLTFHSGEGANKWYYVTVKQGRNRLVRRLWESQGVKVSRLIRVRYGAVALPEKIRAHDFYELDAKELQGLLTLVDM